MAQRITPGGSLENLPGPVGGQYTPQQIDQMIGNIGGQIEMIEMEWEGDDIVVFHRVNAPLQAQLNKPAERMFMNEFFGNVVFMPLAEAPSN